MYLFNLNTQVGTMDTSFSDIDNHINDSRRAADAARISTDIQEGKGKERIFGEPVVLSSPTAVSQENIRPLAQTISVRDFRTYLEKLILEARKADKPVAETNYEQAKEFGYQWGARYFIKYGGDFSALLTSSVTALYSFITRYKHKQLLG
jgi:hypothetical protein